MSTSVNTFSYRFKRKLNEHLSHDRTGWSFLKYSIKWIFSKSHKKTIEICLDQPVIPRSDCNVQIAVKITGGLGDYIVLGRVLRDLSNYVGKLECYIFVPNTKYAEWVYENIPGVKTIYPDFFIDKCKKDCDCILYLNSFSFFDEQNINLEKIHRVAPRLLEVFANSVKNRRPWNIFIDNHPVLDGAFARQVVALGYNRYSFIHYCLGIPNTGNLFDVRFSDEEVKVVFDKFNYYITINTGFDHQFVIGTRFATKCYPVEHWEALVKLIKEEYPQLGIVQVGGKNSPFINGCDIHYENQLSLSHSAGLLKNSLLHIDIEGGLVHLCAALGTPSLVLFGPTSKRYFAYDENINLNTGECSDCWWASECWMEHCPKGFDSPQCMYQLYPEKIYSQISDFLKTQGIKQ